MASSVAGSGRGVSALKLALEQSQRSAVGAKPEPKPGAGDSLPVSKQPVAPQGPVISGLTAALQGRSLPRRIPGGKKLASRKTEESSPKSFAEYVQRGQEEKPNEFDSRPKSLNYVGPGSLGRQLRRAALSLHFGPDAP